MTDEKLTVTITAKKLWTPVEAFKPDDESLEKFKGEMVAAASAMAQALDARVVGYWKDREIEKDLDEQRPTAETIPWNLDTTVDLESIADLIESLRIPVPYFAHKWIPATDPEDDSLVAFMVLDIETGQNVLLCHPTNLDEIRDRLGPGYKLTEHTFGKRKGK